ncbi:hypothetical protein AZA_87739 [Nitrospirillum viridazoti Y2]|nr:hypothetical protein [Nitrospirillum amazonense]EGY02631.1 hypothetical protein AZA_87739 [Nitrospirillum amazonense Y2]
MLFVLPAEFDIDPTGFGRFTGLTKIANPGMSPEQKRGALRTGVLTPLAGTLTPEPGKTDHWEFELDPYAGIELKYDLAEGKAMTFRWRATGPLHYDMHAHPFVGGTALTESYSVSEASSMQGRYVAAFTGIHGWYWQNRSMELVKLTLDASGGITGARIFDAAGEHKRPLGK